MKRKIEVAVISDTHLGTYGCHAAQLNDYLKSIDPKILVLNGDIVDMWQFKKRYWPQKHNAVVKQIFKMLEKGTKVYYITGNHDDRLRKHTGLILGGLELKDELSLTLNGEKHLFLHGDVFDMVVQNNKWLSILGGYSYDLLVLLNRTINHVLEKIGKERMSFSKKVKNSVKGAIKFINNFEQTVISYALDKGYNTVVCGHIHQPKITTYVTEGQCIKYLNSGDWVENCTALEYGPTGWELYEHNLSNPLQQKLKDKAI